MFDTLLKPNFQTETGKIKNYTVFSENHKTSIVCDWLKVSGLCKNFPKPNHSEIYFENGAYQLIWTESGSKTHRYIFKVFYNSLQIGILETSPNLPTIHSDNFLFKLENNLLYQSDFLELLNGFLDHYQAKITNISRVDIAIDNIGYLIPFLNDYWRNNQDKKVLRKGKKVRKTKKSGFSCYNETKENSYFLESQNTLYLDESSNIINGFRFGSRQSNKYITIYNKTNELETSNKKYIERFWQENGIDTNNPVYRFELRLESEAVKAIKDFDISKINEAGYLASIVRTHIRNYFDFVYNTDSNISRCKPIELFNFEQMQGTLLQKCKQKDINDRYKAKITIHCLFKLTLEKRISEKTYQEVKNYINELLEKFDLNDWFLDRLTGWQEKYTKLNRNQDIIYNQVLSFWVQYYINGSLSIEKLKKLLADIDFQDKIIFYKSAKESGYQGSFRTYEKHFELYKNIDLSTRFNNEG